MNGAHDMGGAQGFGPVMREVDEPWFHHEWERRVLALTLATGALRQWNIDQSRSARENVPPSQYLDSSYYEIWFEGLQKLLVEHALVDPTEIASGAMSTPPKPHVAPLAPENVESALHAGSPTLRTIAAPARFAIGDRIRTRMLNPATHTRLPRYCRGREGVVTALHGAHVYPDARAYGDEDPQWLYTIRFAAKALWGPDTTASAVFVDCWEPYLEPLQ